MTRRTSRPLGIAVLVCCALAVTCSGSKHATPNGDGGGPPCSSDGMCPPTTPYCDTNAGFCVECVGDTNCGSGRYCSPSEACVSCVTDSQCNTGAPICSPDGQCVQCLDASQCGSDQTCRTADNRCVAGCSTSAMCRTPTAVCDTTRMYCVQCVQGSDCPATANICDPSDGTCVQCLADADCKTAPRTKCNTTNQMCVQCLTGSDCPNGQSCTFGTCR